MNNIKKYRAFGLVVESAFSIAQLPQAAEGEPDVRIVFRPDLTEAYPPQEQQYTSASANYFTVPNLAVMRISGGNLIEIQPFPGCPESHLGVYLMGSCMGAILHQRGVMPLHGSCVTDGKRAILITGDSGAGKSTLAAEFLKQGWRLVTDDVTALSDVNGIPMVQSSYPSQKLWKDALDRYELPREDVHSLYFTDTREKFGVDVTKFFFDGTAELSLVIRLIAADHPCIIAPIKGMTKVDQLMQNTYRPRMIEPGNVQRHFQRCVTLSTKIPMALVIRENGKQCADTLYSMITDYLGGLNNE